MGATCRGENMKKMISIAITLLMLINGMLVVVNESTGFENTVENFEKPVYANL